MPTVGDQLKAARQARHQSLEEISRVIRVRAEYLAALEADDLTKLPSAVHARGFLRLYAEHLGLNLDEIIARARETQAEEQTLQGPLPSAPNFVNEATSASLPIWKKWIEAARKGWENLHPRLAARLSFRRRRITTTPQASAASEATPAKEAPLPAPSPAEATPPSPQPPPSKEAEPSQATPAAPSPTPDEETSTTVTPLPSSRERPRTTTTSAEPLSSRLFRELGAHLRQHREQLGLTLSACAQETRIHVNNLQHLEEGNLEALPSPIITRGLLAKYAEFLGLEVDEVLLQFAEVLQTRVRERGQIASGGSESRPVLPRVPTLTMLLSADLLFGILILVTLATFALWSINTFTAAVTTRQPVRTTPIPQVLAANPVMATFTPTPTEGPLIPTNTPIPLTPLVLPTPKGKVQVVVIALERVFLRILVDGKPVLEERAAPGATYTLDAQERVEVLVANAGVVRVYYNGSDLGLLGKFGETITRIFTAQGIATPTATPSPTPTTTPTPTITPSITLTPRWTNTPLPTSTPMR